MYKQIAFLSLLFWLPLINYEAIGTKTIEKPFVSGENKIDLKFSDSDGFLNYWKEFRLAILAHDSNSIITLTHFPFETRGTLDSDPIVKYRRSKFTSIFNKFLKQANGLDTKGSTELDFIKATKNPIKVDISDNYTRLGNMVFKKINNKWKFILAYLDTVTYWHSGK